MALMLTLGIETSGRTGAVALCRDGACLEERQLPQIGRRHAQTLVAEIDRMFREFGMQPSDCCNVAVSIGPGSFTGLRVGVVFAKTFAYATRCRLAAVDTFQSIAANSPAEVTDVFVVGDAQRSELYAGRYRRESNGTFVRDGEITIVDGEKWCGERTADDVLSGPGIEKFEQRLSGCCRVLKTQQRLSQAAVIARLGEARIRSGSFDEIWKLEPFYLRKSAAEEKWNAANQTPG